MDPSPKEALKAGDTNYYVYNTFFFVTFNPIMIWHAKASFEYCVSS